MPLIMPESVSAKSVGTKSVGGIGRAQKPVSSGVRTRHAELIPIRIEERHPAETVHVLAGGAQLPRPRRAAPPRRRDPDSPKSRWMRFLPAVGSGTFWNAKLVALSGHRDDVEPTVVFPRRCFRPTALPTNVASGPGSRPVEGDHAECESHAHTLMEATDKDSRSRAEMRTIVECDSQRCATRVAEPLFAVFIATGLLLSILGVLA